jgi:DNA-binding transcriptional LysR family regulator
MNLRQLELFNMVAETSSVSETARNMYMTQPAVSQTILDMENDLQVRLFERMNRKMRLTYAGEVMFQYSKRILQLIEEAESHIQDIANTRVGRLRMGASTTIGIYLLPHILGDFQKLHSAIHSYFTIDNTAVIEEMILDNTIDIALVEGPVHSDSIAVDHLIDDELYLICSPQHQWVKEGRSIIEPDELRGEALILREKGSGTREVIEQAFNRHSIFYEPSHVINNTEAIKRAVMADIGIAFVSRVAVKDEIKDGRLMRMFLAGVQFSREFRIIYHKHKYQSPLLDTFIRFVHEYMDEYKEDYK